MTDMTWRERLEWLAEKHITREYRTTTFGEHDARQILAALSPQGSEPAPAPAQQAVTDGWQPIETAPKDGTPVIAGYYGSQPAYEMHWRDGSQNYWKLAGWYFCDDDVLTSKPRDPEVWHPMLTTPPAQPTTAQGDSDA